LAMVLTFTVAANAQTVLKSQYGLSVDTVTNAATKYLTLSQTSGSYFKTVSVAVGVTEISGTTGGTVTCEASLDGVVWYDVYNTVSNTGATYSFAPSDVTTAQSYRFKINGWGDKYLRVKYVGTGTMAATITAKATFIN